MSLIPNTNRKKFFFTSLSSVLCPLSFPPITSFILFFLWHVSVLLFLLYLSTSLFLHSLGPSLSGNFFVLIQFVLFCSYTQAVALLPAASHSFLVLKPPFLSGASLRKVCAPSLPCSHLFRPCAHIFRCGLQQLGACQAAPALLHHHTKGLRPGKAWH